MTSVMTDEPNASGAWLAARPSRRRLLRIASILYVLAVFTSTHLPRRVSDELTSQVGVSDKLLHFSAYFGLGALAVLCLATVRPVRGRDYAYLALAIAVAGALDEWTQLIPGINRHADVKDWTADVLGMLCGLAAGRWAVRYLGRSGG